MVLNDITNRKYLRDSRVKSLNSHKIERYLEDNYVFVLSFSADTVTKKNIRQPMQCLFYSLTILNRPPLVLYNKSKPIHYSNHFQKCVNGKNLVLNLFTSKTHKHSVTLTL